MFLFFPQLFRLGSGGEIFHGSVVCQALRRRGHAATGGRLIFGICGGLVDSRLSLGVHHDLHTCIYQY